jgi:hypothetical protein
MAPSPKRRPELFWNKQRRREFPSSQAIRQLLYIEDAITDESKSRRDSSQQTIVLTLNESESIEFFARFIYDVLHDNDSARGGKALKSSYPKFHDFIRDMLASMWKQYDPAVWSARAAHPELDEYATRIEMFIREKFVKTTTRGQAKAPDSLDEEIDQEKHKSDFPNIDENVIVKATLEKMRQSMAAGTIFSDGIQGKDIADNEVVPVEIMYDQGNQTIAAETGRFLSVHIGLVNFLDQGDGYRTRNNILSSLRGIANEATEKVEDCTARKALAKKCIRDLLPKELQAVPHTDALLDSFDAVFEMLNKQADALGRPKVPAKFYAAFMRDVLVEGFQASQRTPKSFLRDFFTITNGQLQPDAEEISVRWHEWLGNIRNIAQNAVAYIIHHRPVRMKVTLTFGGRAIPFMDIRYKLHQSTPYIELAKVNADKSLGKFMFYDTFSAADVTTWWKQYGKGQKESRHEDMFVACLMKFVGDFCQILYAFHYGMVFSSGDRSCIATAFFLMHVLASDQSRMLAFKRNYARNEDARVFKARLIRGMSILDKSTSLFAGGIRYYVDVNANAHVVLKEATAEVNPCVGKLIKEGYRIHQARNEEAIKHRLKEWAQTIGADFYGNRFHQEGIPDQGSADNRKSVRKPQPPRFSPASMQPPASSSPVAISADTQALLFGGPLKAPKAKATLAKKQDTTPKATKAPAKRPRKTAAVAPPPPPSALRADSSHMAFAPSASAVVSPSSSVAQRPQPKRGRVDETAAPRTLLDRARTFFTAFTRR